MPRGELPRGDNNVGLSGVNPSTQNCDSLVFGTRHSMEKRSAGVDKNVTSAVETRGRQALGILESYVEAQRFPAWNHQTTTHFADIREP